MGDQDTVESPKHQPLHKEWSQLKLHYLS